MFSDDGKNRINEFPEVYGVEWWVYLNIENLIKSFLPYRQNDGWKQNFFGFCLNFRIDIGMRIVIDCEKDICIW